MFCYLWSLLLSVLAKKIKRHSCIVTFVFHFQNAIVFSGRLQNAKMSLGAKRPAYIFNI